MKFKKPKKVLKLDIIEDKCVGCGKCAKMCKQCVFAIADNKAVIKDISCGKCVEKMCKFGAIELTIAPN